MPGDDLCKEHSGMVAILERVEKGLGNLWGAYGDLAKQVTSNNEKVLTKLGELKEHFITQEGVRDRRKLDSIKSLGKNILRAAGWILALGLTGGLSYVTAYAAILKFWR
ncbi:MAG: hypothetical protein KAS66_00245 [Candidatus Omnitrophica bacterium]|nr:hypothetical protein [Candidatus Omnitrophota bacterium]